ANVAVAVNKIRPTLVPAAVRGESLTTPPVGGTLATHELVPGGVDGEPRVKRGPGRVHDAVETDVDATGPERPVFVTNFSLRRFPDRPAIARPVMDVRDPAPRIVPKRAVRARVPELTLIEAGGEEVVAAAAIYYAVGSVRPPVSVA